MHGRSTDSIYTIKSWQSKRSFRKTKIYEQVNVSNSKYLLEENIKIKVFSWTKLEVKTKDVLQKHDETSHNDNKQCNVCLQLFTIVLVWESLDLFFLLQESDVSSSKCQNMGGLCRLGECTRSLGKQDCLVGICCKQRPITSKHFYSSKIMTTSLSINRLLLIQSLYSLLYILVQSLFF